MPSILSVLAAYLLGSVSFGVVVSRAMGLSDPRGFGSGNPGATNVLRSGSKAAAAVTLLLDLSKGLLPVLLVRQYGAAWGLDVGIEALVGLAAFLGHLYPVFFGFRGGKGVATAAGVLLGFQPWLGVAALASWVIIVAFFRYSSLAALVAAVFAPVYYLLLHGVVWQVQRPLLLATLAMSALLVWRHRQNIRRLLAGTEPRVGERG